MNDYVGEELAQLIADYCNQLFSQGKTVDKHAIMGVYVAYVDRECEELLERIKSARVQ